MASPPDRPAPSRPSRLIPWLIFGPLLVISGAVLGRFYPELVGRQEPPVWTEPVVSRPEPARVTQRLPSLAPLLDTVRQGVVEITSFGPRSDGRNGETPVAGTRGLGRFQNPTDSILNIAIRGTGFVVHEDGLIVTCHHVVAGYDTIRVRLADNTQHAAHVVGEDAVSDLALLRMVDPPAGVQALNLGNSDATRQGDWVMSLGNPLGFHDSLSVGLITYKGRHIPEDGVQVTNEYLQFSAPVNPGDSGAPLFDMDGSVIGITRRTLDDGHAISFATPSKAIKGLLVAVERGDARVRRGYLGMQFRTPSRSDELRGLVDEGGGAEVVRVIKGHPADQAGIREGDVILSYAGLAVEHAADLYDRITESTPGERMPVSVCRSGRVLAPMTVTVGQVGKHGSPE